MSSQQSCTTSKGDSTQKRNCETSSNLSPVDVIKLIRNSDKVDIRKANAWKKKPHLMPEGVKKGLKKCIKISKICKGMSDMVIYKGVKLPKKAVCMIVVADILRKIEKISENKRT